MVKQAVFFSTAPLGRYTTQLFSYSGLHGYPRPTHQSAFLLLRSLWLPSDDTPISFLLTLTSDVDYLRPTHQSAFFLLRSPWLPSANTPISFLLTLVSMATLGQHTNQLSSYSGLHGYSRSTHQSALGSCTGQQIERGPVVMVSMSNLCLKVERHVVLVLK